MIPSLIHLLKHSPFWKLFLFALNDLCKADYQARIAGIVNGFGSHRCVIKSYISTTLAPFRAEELAQGVNLHGHI